MMQLIRSFNLGKRLLLALRTVFLVGALCGAFGDFSRAQLPVESLITAATTGPAHGDGRAWVYVAWSPGNPEVLRGRTLGLYSKPGAPAANASFVLVAAVTEAPRSAGAIAPLLARGVELGDGLADLAATLDALTGDEAVRGAVGADAKLAIALDLARTRPDLRSLLELLATRFHGVRFALGHAWAGRMAAGPVTLEVREIDPGTGNDLQVVARVTLNAGSPVELPAPGAPVLVPPRLTADDLRVALLWAEPDDLRRRSPLVAGFDVWRMPATKARELGLEARPPTRSELQLQAEQINRLPLVPTRRLTVAEAALVRDPEGAFVVDSGPTAGAWKDGDEFAWFVAARDFLGTPGGVSEGRFGFVCAAMPPPAPRDLGFENGFSGEGATALRQPTVTLRWSRPVAEPGTLTRFEVYRGATNLPPVAATNEPPASARVAEIAFDAATARYEWTDASFDARADTNLWGRGFWYAVRTVRETQCGPIASALCPPVFVNLRRYEAPDAPTGELGLNCPRVVVQRPHENLRTERVDPAVLDARLYRLVVRRHDRGVAWAEVTVNTGVAGAAPILSPQLHYGEEDDSVAFDFSLGRTAGEIFSPIIQVVAGGFSGAVSEPLRFELPSDPPADLRFLANVDAATVSLAGADPTNPFLAGLLTGPFPLNDALRGTNEMITARSPTTSGDVLVQAAPPGTGANGAWRFVTITRPFTLVRGQGPLLIFQDPQAPPGANLSEVVIYRAWIINPPRLGQDGGCPHLARPTGSGEVVPLKIRMFLTPRTKAWRVFRRVDDAPLTQIAEGLGEFRPFDIRSIVEVTDDAMPEAAARLCYFGQTSDENGNWSPLGPLGCEDLVPRELPVPLLALPEEEGDAREPIMRLRWFCPPSGVGAFQIILKPMAGKPPVQGNSPATKTTKALLITTPRLTSWFSKSAVTLVSAGPVVPSALRTGPVGLEPAGAALGEGPDFTFPVDVETDMTYEVQVAAVDRRGNIGHASRLHRFTWKVPRPVVDRDVPWPQRPLPPVREMHPGLSAVLLATNLVIWPGSSNTYPVGVRIGRLAIGQRELINDVLGLGDGELGGRLLRLFATRGLISAGRGLETILFSDELSTPPRPSFRPLNVVLYRQQVASDEFPEVSGDVVQVSSLLRRLAVRTLADSSGFEFLDPMVGLTLRLPAGNAVLSSPPPSLEFHLLDLHPVVQGARYRYWLVHFDARGEPDQTIPAGEVEVPL